MKSHNVNSISDSIMDEIKLVDGPQSEKQQNSGRIALLKLAEQYRKGSASRKLLLKCVEESYQ